MFGCFFYKTLNENLILGLFLVSFVFTFALYFRFYFTKIVQFALFSLFMYFVPIQSYKTGKIMWHSLGFWVSYLI